MAKYKILRIFILANLFIFTSESCKNWLELVPPDGLVKNEFWKTKEDVEAVLMGAYQQFAQMDKELFLYGELRGDLLQEDNNLSNDERNIMQGNIYPNNSLCNWTNFYKVINYCNTVLKFAPKVLDIDPTFNEYQLKGFEAEALFLRSLSYFYLVRIFKEVPLMLEPSESDNINFFLGKASSDDILNQIKADLEKAQLFVRDDYGSLEGNKGRATKASIKALLADISLWNFDYKACITYVDDALKDETYQLMSSGHWFDIFYPGNSLEGIFEFQFNKSLNQNNSMYSLTYTEKNYLASAKAIELFTPSISGEIIRGDGTISTNTNKIWKYCGSAPDGVTLRPSSESSSCNWIVYRVADLLLMKAEALSQLQQYNKSLAIINQIRSRALVPPVSIQKSEIAFEDYILQERARELAFEGKRWFDLLRMGRRNNYARKDKLIEILIQNVPSTQKLVLASKLTNPMGWYLPILDKELERNKNLVQNPYYSAF